MQKLGKNRKTPWQKVHEKIGLSSAELARERGIEVSADEMMPERR